MNCMLGSIELMCCRNIWQFSAFWMSKVSSTYPSHIFGGLVAVLMSLISYTSMNRLVTMGLMGNVCLLHVPVICGKCKYWY